MTILSTLEMVDWSRAQFALTAMYHWLFVPLTLGLGFICAFMETIYYRTGDQKWKEITKFWMTLFAINFAIGVATGIILEFEFGTNWSNYSYFVGDIFGAPLAIEGILAFFMEATFLAVMYFGWDRVSKRFHLASTWLTALGANLSAVWILIANSWMQYPVGMRFNPATMRNEMYDFWAVATSDVAINKITHTVTSGFLLASVFVIAVSAWYLLKKRNTDFAKKSIRIAAIFGFISSILVATTGDNSAYIVAKTQPMKFAAMEALMDGERDLGLTAIGLVASDIRTADHSNETAVNMKIEIPGMLTLLATRGDGSFIPGINDLVKGNEKEGMISTSEKMERGIVAINTLKEYNDSKKSGDTQNLERIAALFNYDTTEGKAFMDNYFKYFGYGYFSSPLEIVPNVMLIFYSFRVMVGVGMFLILLFMVLLYLSYKDKLEKYNWLLWIALIALPLTYVCSQAGWIVAEVGRQPWTIQDMLPTVASVSDISSNAVITTFFIFVALFTTLLIAEVRIMLKQIKIGPKNE